MGAIYANFHTSLIWRLDHCFSLFYLNISRINQYSPGKVYRKVWDKKQTISCFLKILHCAFCLLLWDSGKTIESPIQIWITFIEEYFRAFSNSWFYETHSSHHLKNIPPEYFPSLDNTMNSQYEVHKISGVRISDVSWICFMYLMCYKSLLSLIIISQIILT